MVRSTTGLWLLRPFAPECYYFYSAYPVWICLPLCLSFIGLSKMFRIMLIFMPSLLLHSDGVLDNIPLFPGHVSRWLFCSLDNGRVEFPINSTYSPLILPFTPSSVWPFGDFVACLSNDVVCLCRRSEKSASLPWTETETGARQDGRFAEGQDPAEAWQTAAGQTAHTRGRWWRGSIVGRTSAHAGKVPFGRFAQHPTGAQARTIGADKKEHIAYGRAHRKGR